MKDLKEFILEKRIRELKVDGKKVPDKYIAVFNDYLVEIAELIKTHDRELVKEVLKRVKDVAFNSKVICDKEGLPCFGEMRQIYGIYDYELNQIQKEYEK